MMELDKIYNEDCLEGMKRIPDGSVDCVVTSPPYYALRDYGVEGQIGRLSREDYERFGRHTNYTPPSPVNKKRKAKAKAQKQSRKKNRKR